MTTTTDRLNDNAKVEGFEAGDNCPVHGTPHKKVYGFGYDRYVPDAEVCVFQGCGCAVCTQYDPCGVFEYAPRYFRSYNQAAGLARLVKAEYAAKYGGPRSGL